MRAFAGALLLLLVSGCDWHGNALFNSIPFRGDPARNPVVRVYLSVDGLSHSTVEEAKRRGAFSGPGWRNSKFITGFPGTSDASWTRILHTAPMAGYEYEHYDRASGEMRLTGLKGFLFHAMPNFHEKLGVEPIYYKSFDYRANGYLHTAGVYLDTFSSMAESVDNLFINLEARAETDSDFSAYLLEFDVLGHMREPRDVTDALIRLGQRIERFRDRHRERTFLFTLMSDHGMDFKPVPKDHLIVFEKEMERVGVTPVRTLKGQDGKRSVHAVTIRHTRVTYVELHTSPELIADVAARVSRVGPVDVVVSTLPGGNPGVCGERDLPWYAVWERGAAIARFAFDGARDRYVIDPQAEGTDLPRLGVSLPEPESTQGRCRIFTDEQLFAATRHGNYPDLFYRVRTALLPVGVKNPADVIVSLKGSYVSMGASLPGGASDLALSAFHGALDAPGTLGALLTEERDLPDAVRSDTLLHLFPRLRQHIRRRGVFPHAGDPHESLEY